MVAIEGKVKDGQIRFGQDITLPEEAIVYVVVPSMTQSPENPKLLHVSSPRPERVAAASTSYNRTPRLADPSDLHLFRKTMVIENQEVVDPT